MPSSAYKLTRMQGGMQIQGKTKTCKKYKQSKPLRNIKRTAAKERIIPAKKTRRKKRAPSLNVHTHKHSRKRMDV
jgi:hypothetical protein